MTPAGTINIASHLAVMAARQPEAAALIEVLSRAKDGTLAARTTSYRELDARANVLARGLHEAIPLPGTRVALCVRPGLDFFAVTFALFRLGAVPVLIDPGIGVKNFKQCLAEAEPAVFIGIPAAHILRMALGWARKTVRLNITTGWFGGKTLRAIRSAGEAQTINPVVESAPGDPAAILFTSGSTGPPKGVLYTHGNFDAQVRALRDLYNIQPGEIDLATFPLFGLFGPALGMTTVIPQMDFTRPGFVEPRNIIDAVRQFAVTNMFGSPALLKRVGSSAAGQSDAEPTILLPSLKRVISAGAPVSTGILRQFARLLAAGAQIFTPYGATESLPVTSIGSDEILTETATQTDAGKGVCVGRPVAGMEVRIIGIRDESIADWSASLELPTGQMGEIVVKGPQVTGQYFNRPEATSLAKIADATGGFFHRMGDVGYFDDRGRLWFCGRKSQRVKTLAGDLYSAPFEGVFNAHPMVARSALVGVPRGGGIHPVICIETTRDCVLPRSELRTQLRALAMQYSHTTVTQDFLFHPSFPVDIRHNAKIGREILSIWAAAEMSRPK